MKTTPPGSTSGENPLVPHRLLRQMYAAMLELRLFDEHAHRGSRKNNPEEELRITGFEAALAAVLLGLKAGDMVLDATGSQSVEHLLEGTVPNLLLQKSLPVSASSALPLKHLPFIANGERRLIFALGSAAAAKVSGRHQAVVVYVLHREIEKSAWRWALANAMKQELPILFVLLPKLGRSDGGGYRDILGLAKKDAVPGISIEGTDSIALYRVAQESLGRIRGGDGPVLMECVTYKLPGKQPKDQSDAVLKLKQYLLDRRIADAAWLSSIERDLSASLPRPERRKSARK